MKTAIRVVCGAFLLAAVSCVTAQPTAIKSAESAMARRDWQTAIIYLDDYIFRHPNGDRIQQAMFERGECYYRIKDYYSAARAWVAYVNRYPDGLFVEDVYYRFQVLMQVKRVRDLKVAEIRENAEARVAAARERLDANASDCWANFEVANALWELARYDEAAEHYVNAIYCDEAVAQRPEVSSRIVWKGGDWRANVPGAPPREGVVVIETYKYPSINYGTTGSESFDRYEVITGRVKNLSPRRAYGVEVVVTTYDFFDHILDSKTVRIGDLEPFQELPFSLRFQTPQAGFQDHTVRTYKTTVKYDLEDNLPKR